MTAPGSTPALWGRSRTPLEGPSEEVVLLGRARERSDRIARSERMVVHSSPRRPRARGARRTPLWRRDHRCRPADPKQVHAG
ncbi:hypothetical protein [Streptomyces pini]|uniref:Uncharacterized protein n=1 Tax=Streptomyces pini TaxID=1520580 RepID=A0A1I3XXG4_9ACTN|nr:hypothetical protein [Streptomyces pini]SFK23696.1 hypothetical protein SAMN05192584_104349 [Streptomyces pini]